MTCAFAIWETTRVEVFGAFPAEPSLRERGLSDGVGDLYLEMERRGELRTFPGQVSPAEDFLDYVYERLKTEKIERVTADRYKAKELQASKLGKRFKVELNAMGLGRDGTAAVIAFQKMALSDRLHCNSLMLKVCRV